MRPLKFNRSREPSAVASARSSAAGSPRPQYPMPLADWRQRAVRSRTFSRRSPSSPFAVRSTHRRTRRGGHRPKGGPAGFDFGREAFSDWHRPTPRWRPRRPADVRRQAPGIRFAVDAFSRRRAGAQVDFGDLGRVLCLGDDQTVIRATPTQKRPPKTASTSIGGDLVDGAMTTAQEGELRHPCAH